MKEERLSAIVLQELVRDSFMTEINALKPGNVSRYANGHGMTRDDFVLSAELVSPILCDHRLTIGQRILDSVKITRRRVGTNTNLGMLCLFAPLVVSAEDLYLPSVAALQDSLRQILSAVGKLDSALIFQAIREANPGGLGHSELYDVHSLPDCTVLEAMNAAKERDSIARQYCTGFQDIFFTGFTAIKEFTALWNSVEWASVACYLAFLSSLPDSHIARKYGNMVAEQVRSKAAVIADVIKKNNKPEDAQGLLLEFDRDLKKNNINPGTSADLTAASILVYKLVKN